MNTKYFQGILNNPLYSNRLCLLCNIMGAFGQKFSYFFVVDTVKLDEQNIELNDWSLMTIISNQWFHHFKAYETSQNLVAKYHDSSYIWFATDMHFC